ncbi:MAG TPA: CPCC family cysteine-rich protein [Longimicrobium sp.]|nr:CPCC family cysteine-rich protein [Longimicrobium sp.]
MSMDDALFRVNTTITLSTRDLFFLSGDILGGEVRMGMIVTAEPGFREPVQAAEFTDYRAERRAEVALGFRYATSAELARWRSIPWEGAILRIPPEPILHPCPCCSFRTLAEEERGGYEICGVCGWEDDPVQLNDPDYRGGANQESLNEARAAFFALHPHSAPRHHG